MGLGAINRSGPQEVSLSLWVTQAWVHSFMCLCLEKLTVTNAHCEHLKFLEIDTRATYILSKIQFP